MIDATWSEMSAADWRRMLWLIDTFASLFFIELLCILLRLADSRMQLRQRPTSSCSLGVTVLLSIGPKHQTHLGIHKNPNPNNKRPTAISAYERGGFIAINLHNAGLVSCEHKTNYIRHSKSVQLHKAKRRSEFDNHLSFASYGLLSWLGRDWSTCYVCLCHSFVQSTRPIPG